jgi:hypothetical protein
MKPTRPIPSFGQPTEYRGVKFKSKCEARWAALFDLLKWEWEYEPNGEDTFPDFLVSPKESKPFHFEVKGGLVGFEYGRREILEVDGAHPEAEDTRLYNKEGHPEVTGAHYPEHWASHPDAIKARQSASKYKHSVAVGDSEGHHYSVYSHVKSMTDPGMWFRTKFKGQSQYDWDRTLVMVTGKKKH